MQNGAKTENPPADFSERREREIIFLLCILAAIHVFIFSAAFPLFNNVDEKEHLDLVVKYSHGRIPRGIESPSRETMQYLAVYDSQEFVAPPGEKIPPPPWTQPPEKILTDLQDREEKLWPTPNYESSQPPLYYFFGAAWWHLGQWLGLDAGRLVYWLRFLNIVFVAALIWLGFTPARIIFPANIFLRFGVPTLIAFMPQTAFYSINNDILSPLCFGTSFLFLIRFWCAEIPSARLGFAAGLALAATYLVKISNLPLLVVSAAFVFWKIFSMAKSKKLRASLPSLAALFFSAALPIAIWVARTRYFFGDFTGSAAKIHFLTWTARPFTEWWHHPIFTLDGAWKFLSELLGNFWQGEFWWHHQPMTLPLMNFIYTLLSFGFVLVALINLRPKFSAANEWQRRTLWFAFAAFAAAIGFLALLSIIYDFHDCPNPSRAHPFFNQGRLMLGALIPFLLLFVFGIDRALNRFGNAAKFSALAGIVLFMLIVEIVTDWPAMFSEYNWFHL